MGDKEKKRNWKNMIAGGTAIIVIVGIIAGIVALMSIFGGAIMNLFGFTYDSVGSVILFFIVSGIIAYPADLITSTLPAVLAEMGKIQRRTAIVVRIVLDTLCNCIIMAVVDYFMDSVAASDPALFMVSLVFAVADVWLDERDKKEEKDESEKEREVK